MAEPGDGPNEDSVTDPSSQVIFPFDVIMNAHTENQSWVVHRGGGVVEKKALAGVASLSDWERLVYCLG